MKPKGRLLIIGGSEDKGDDRSIIRVKPNEYTRLEILRELLPKNNKKIEIITSASRLPQLVKKEYKKAFRYLGCTRVGFLPIHDRLQANDEKTLRRIEEAGVVFFTGGYQLNIVTILGGTKLFSIIKRKYMTVKSFIVAGTSAGAMAMSDMMITDGCITEALIDTDLKTTSGLGLIHDCIIDTHFIKRGRFGRLAHAIIINPGELGIGLGEDSALIIKNGSEAECYGSGMVVIIDGKNIQQTNVAQAGHDEAVYVENLIVHILVKGCRFSIKTRKLLNPTRHPRAKARRKKNV